MILKNISTIAIGALCLLLVSPLTTFGYYTTAQSAQRATDQTALYAIDFYFGFQNEDVYIPVVTQRTDVNDPTNPYVGYTFTTSEGGDTGSGTATGLVFSNLEIVDNMYKVPAGQRGYFTLFVALTLDETENKAKYGLQVTNLPFKKVGASKTEEFGLNIHELGLGKPGLHAYNTKEVGLNR